jgi:diacylglycerol kinase family enzyme
MRSDPEYGQIQKNVSWCTAKSRHNMSLQIDGEPITPENRRQFEFKCLAGKVKIFLQSKEAARLVEKSISSKGLASGASLT